MESETEMKVKEDPDDPQATYSKIEFNKVNLFFWSNPNTIGADNVVIKNTGKTCIYFKWQKCNKPFALDLKKSDGIDRFFCHYSDSKIFPDEEKSFVFSYFSEKNGVFSEDWILATSPPLKNCNLSLHLNGMTHLYIDTYSKAIEDLNSEISKEGIKTRINEVVLDLVETIKESTPPLPDMKDPEVFKYYFNHYNKERK